MYQQGGVMNETPAFEIIVPGEDFIPKQHIKMMQS